MKCVACGKEWSGRMDPHHVVYEQHVRRHKGDPADERNLVPAHRLCHFDHHARTRVIKLVSLPDSVFEFVAELMGPGAAYEYLKLRYAGRDQRLDALLDAWEEAA